MSFSKASNLELKNISPSGHIRGSKRQAVFTLIHGDKVWTHVCNYEIQINGTTIYLTIVKSKLGIKQQ